MRPDQAARTVLLTLLPLVLVMPAGATAGTTSAGPPAADARSLERSLDAVLGRHVRGGLVDYAGLARDGEFTQHLAALADADPNGLSARSDRLAFWINAYNALVLKGVVDHYPIRSVSEAGGLGKWGFFKRLEFRVGGRRLTLDGIEHGILRAGFDEPRIHFALVCASLGCPELQPAAFHGDRVEAELESAARRFVNDPRKVRYDPGARVLRVSRIFDWYEEDFLRSAPSVPAWVGRHLDSGAPPAGTSLEYLDYSWDLNDLGAESGRMPAGARAP